MHAAVLEQAKDRAGVTQAVTAQGRAAGGGQNPEDEPVADPVEEASVGEAHV